MATTIIESITDDIKILEDFQNFLLEIWKPDGVNPDGSPHLHSYENNEVPWQ